MENSAVCNFAVLHYENRKHWVMNTLSILNVPLCWSEYHYIGLCWAIKDNICYIPEVFCLHTKRNVANVLKRAKKQSGKSMEDFSLEMELAKSTLQNYMKGGDD